MFSFICKLLGRRKVSDHYLTGPEVCELFKVHRSTLARWIRRDLFPKPIQLGPRTVRFRKSDIDAIGNSLPRSRGNGAIESGWIVDQPDVAPEKLVNGLPDTAASFEEIEQFKREQHPARAELLA